MGEPTGENLDRVRERRDELRARHLRPMPERPASIARGVHHVALIARDVEETITFYQELLGFPLVELVENRDYAGSSHFFFDLGNGNLLGFFDFPGHEHPMRTRRSAVSSTSRSRWATSSSARPAVGSTPPAWSTSAGPGRRGQHLLP